MPTINPVVTQWLCLPPPSPRHVGRQPCHYKYLNTHIRIISVHTVELSTLVSRHADTIRPPHPPHIITHQYHRCYVFGFHFFLLEGVVLGMVIYEALNHCAVMLTCSRVVVTRSTRRYGGADTTAPWQVCQSSFRLLVKWESMPTLCIDIGCPPVPVMSTSADHLHNGLAYHPSLEPFVEKLSKIRSLFSRFVFARRT